MPRWLRHGSWKKSGQQLVELWKQTDRLPVDPLEEGAFCVSNGEFGFFDVRVVFVCVRAVFWFFLFFFNLVFVVLLLFFVLVLFCVASGPSCCFLLFIVLLVVFSWIFRGCVSVWFSVCVFSVFLLFCFSFFYAGLLLCLFVSLVVCVPVCRCVFFVCSCLFCFCFCFVCDLAVLLFGLLCMFVSLYFRFSVWCSSCFSCSFDVRFLWFLFVSSCPAPPLFVCFLLFLLRGVSAVFLCFCLVFILLFLFSWC